MIRRIIHEYQTMQQPDLTTILSAADGNVRSFEVIVDTYQAFVYAVAFRFLNSRADAEDVTQDVFLNLWRNLKKYRPEVKLTTWLYRIIVNRCLDVMKSKNFRFEHSQIEVQPSLAISPPADEMLLRQEVRQLVQQCAEQLTPKQKVVFVLRDLEGLDINEITEILSMTASNIKANLYYARKRVSELLSKHYEEKKQRSYEM